MAADFRSLKDAVSAYVSRPESALIINDVNLLEVAINNALVYAQRKHDFEWNNELVEVACNPKGNVWSGATLADTVTAVKVKRMDKAYLRNTAGDEYPIDLVSKQTLARCIELSIRTGVATSETPPSVPQRAVMHGQTVWLHPLPTSTPYDIWFDAVVWLEPLVGPTDTNFLVEMAHDYFVYRSIMELNMLLKEDQRFEETAKLMRDAWESLVDWDSRLTSPSDSELDL